MPESLAAPVSVPLFHPDIYGSFHHNTKLDLLLIITLENIMSRWHVETKSSNKQQQHTRHDDPRVMLPGALPRHLAKGHESVRITLGTVAIDPLPPFHLSGRNAFESSLHKSGPRSTAYVGQSITVPLLISKSCSFVGVLQTRNLCATDGNSLRVSFTTPVRKGMSFRSSHVIDSGLLGKRAEISSRSLS